MSIGGVGFGAIGFTADLRADLSSSNMLLNDWFERQVLKSGRVSDNIKTNLTESQRQIDIHLSSLKALQQEQANFVHESGDHEMSPSKTSDKMPLCEQIRELSMKIELTRLSVASKKQVVEGLVYEHSVRKERASESKRIKDSFRSSKTATINDLTKGIINYKYTGLDFEKADDDRLRFSFTQLDPNNPDDKFSFEIGVENDRWVVVNLQPILIKNEVIQKCVVDLNETDDMTALVQRVRDAFVDELSIQFHNI